MVKIAPSILSADFSDLMGDIRKIELGGGDYIHVDVMDGHFVPNITYGAPVLKCLNGKTDLPYDIHLMIEDPDRFIKDFVMPNTEFIVVHKEACIHLDRTIEFIKSFGVKAGVALNPATPPETLEYVINKLDLILVMSVNPGFGGQKFIENTYKKTLRLKELIERKNSEALIQIDGGVNYETAKKLFDCGADILVAGSFIFNSDNSSQTISRLKHC